MEWIPLNTYNGDPFSGRELQRPTHGSKIKQHSNSPQVLDYQ